VVSEIDEGLKEFLLDQIRKAQSKEGLSYISEAIKADKDSGADIFKDEGFLFQLREEYGKKTRELGLSEKGVAAS
jgi:hypothetical protein